MLHKKPRSKHSWISLTRTNPIPLRLCMKSSDITMHAGDFARAFVVVLRRVFYVAQIDKSLPFFFDLPTRARALAPVS